MARSCEVSAHRTLTLIALFVFSIGWLFFAIGLCWELLEWMGEVDSSVEQGPEGMSRSNSTLFPYYITLVGGPFLVLFELLHTLLPGVISSVFGAISIFVGSFYFMSVGDVAFRCGFNISYTLYEKSQFPYPDISVSPRVGLRFSGVVIECLSWTIVLILSQFYKRHTVNVHRNTRWPLTLGYARIVSMACITLSAIFWCVHVVGKHSLDVNGANIGLYTLNDAGTFVVPPLLFIAALMYVGYPGDSGILLSILHMLFVVFMGSVVISYGLAYPGCDQYTCHAVKQIIGGSVSSLFCWMLAMSLRPFYRQRPLETAANSSQQQPDMVHEEELPHETQPLIQNMEKIGH